jgi:hypothetical protein
MHAIAWHEATREMRCVLERRMIDRKHDIAEQCELRVDRGRCVDGNHGRLNFEQVHQQTFGRAQPRFGVDAAATEMFLMNEGFARARKDDDLVLGIAADMYPDGYRYSRFCERYRRWTPHWLAVL